MNYYDILDVPKDASADVIKKQYKKKALKHHPDRGGNAEMFKKYRKRIRRYQIRKETRIRQSQSLFTAHAADRRPFHHHRQQLILLIQILFFSIFSITISSNNLHNTCSIRKREIPQLSIYERLRWVDIRKACRRKFTETQK